MTDYKKTVQRVGEHLDYAMELPCVGDNWFVIGVQGSQNYNLDDDESDIDTKLIMLPSFKDILFNKRAYSTTHDIDGEHVDVKDVRLYFDLFKKQNLQFCEILFTDYVIVNPVYQDVWDALVEDREVIVHYDRCKALRYLKYMARQKMDAMCHRYPSKVEVIDEYGYDPKQLSHLFRIEYMVRDYIDDVPFEECLIAPDRDFLIAVKRGEANVPSGVDAALSYAKTTLTEIESAVDLYCEKWEGYGSNPLVEELLDELLWKLMERHMRNEFGGER